jgi:putative PIN family toxin of toxin-antitoxin system
MRLVVDTNIFISAALTNASWPANTVRWLAKYGGLLKSEATEQELFMVLERPRLAAKVAPFFLADLRRLFEAAERVAITERIVVCRDPADDKFLELAVSGKAEAIITATSIFWRWIPFARSRSSHQPRSAARGCGYRAVERG